MLQDRASGVDYASLDEVTLVGLAQSGQREAFRQIVQCCNQRLFRVARGVIDDDLQAEDIVQEAYLHAFEKLQTFRGDATLLTWMTRILLNVAYGRLRRRRTTVGVEQIEASQLDSAQVIPFPSKFGSEDPAATVTRAQIRTLLEHAIDELPSSFKVVFIMREIEECSVEETAQALNLREQTVKTRLHRARRLLRTSLQGTLSNMLTDAFPFLGTRCERMTAAVMERLVATYSSR